ncbi:MAG: histidine phosphatase family protein, partial [bacterium]
MSSFVNDLMRKLFLLGDDNTGYLVFVRHGESRRQSDSSDVKGFDTPLSSRGRRQARAVADRLKHRTIDALYSSPLKRARETAEVTAEETDLESVVRD